MMNFLTYIKRQESVTPREVANFLRISTPTARTYMGFVEAAGLVQLQRASKNDPSQAWRVTNSELWHLVPRELLSASSDT